MNPLDAAAVARAATAEPDWRSDLRRTAHDHYEKLSMPTSAEELWRYIDLDFVLDDFGLADPPDGDTGAAQPQVLVGAQNIVTVVDGATTDVTGDRTGQWFGPLRATPDAVDAALEAAAPSRVPSDVDLFAAAHDAFGTDGAVVHVPKGVAGGTVLIDVRTQTPGTVSFPRIVVVAGEAAVASVVVLLRSPADVRSLVVPRLEVVAGNASNVKLSVVQELGRSATSIAHGRASVGRDASLVLAEASLGGTLSRLHLTVDLEGRGSSADVVGAYFGDRQQVLDYRYFMHHAGLNTRSDMFLKGAVEDEALSVFTGMIRIDESAQRTDAFQTNRNLILSEGAAAQSVPNLEILANDVRCGHGSTMGPLDKEQRYYLMSRGLEPERADRLQVRGFFQEALDRFPHPELAAPLAEKINSKFVAAQEEGRL